MITLTVREAQVVEALEVFGWESSPALIAEVLGISNKNASSYFHYLRSKGFKVPRHNEPVKKARPAVNWLDKYEGKWA
jgi:hypothetical protein